MIRRPFQNNSEPKSKSQPIRDEAAMLRQSTLCPGEESIPRNLTPAQTVQMLTGLQENKNARIQMQIRNPSNFFHFPAVPP